MERHNLINEFPEFREKIHQLKVENTHFRKIFDEYHELEHRIHNINTGEEIVIDEYAHELKAKLLHLKDEIYSHLNSLGLKKSTL
jgi:uncharacterized protein YdcH (DUF465 family)